MNENASKTAAASAIMKKDATLAPSPSPSEAQAIANASERMAVRRARIAASVKSEYGVLGISSPHSDTIGFVSQLYDCFGTGSAAFAEQAIARLV